MAAAVASGSPQYPLVTIGPRTRSSPGSPAAGDPLDKLSGNDVGHRHRRLPDQHHVGDLGHVTGDVVEGEDDGGAVVGGETQDPYVRDRRVHGATVYELAGLGPVVGARRV